MRELIELGSFNAARQIAHDIKGVAGNLSATVMAASAASLEHALSREQADTSGEQRDFRETLESLTKAITLQLPETKTDLKYADDTERYSN